MISIDSANGTFTLAKTANVGDTVTVAFAYQVILDSAGLNLNLNTISSNYIGINITDVSINGVQITNNNLDGIGLYAVQLIGISSNITLPASNNYWGTTDPTAISDMIFDNLDDFNLGTVNVINPVPQKIDISSE